MKKRFLALALGTLAFGVALGGVKMGLGHQDALMVKAAVTEKTIVFDAKTLKGSGTTLSNDIVNINVGSGTLDNGSEYRIFKNQPVTITLNEQNAKIVKIVFTCTAKDTSKYGPGCFQNNGSGEYSFSGFDGTWTGLADSVELIAATNQVRATKIVVTTQSSATNPEPSSPIKSIQLSSDGSFTNSQFKGQAFNATGLTVKAHYEDTGVAPTDVTLEKVKWVLKEDLAGAPIDFLNTDNVILDDVAAKEYFLCAQYETFTSSEAIKLTIKDQVLVSAIEIALDATSIQSSRFTTAKIVSTVPEDATDKTVNWHVVDGTVASIDSTGKVTGLKAGKTQIYATAKDKGAVESNKVEITVTEYEAKTYHQIVAEQVDYSGTYLLGYKASATEVYTWNGKDLANGYNTASFADGVLTGNERADASYIVLDRLFDGKTLKGYTAKLVDGTGAELYFNQTSNSENGFDMDAQKKACYQVEFAEGGVDIFVPNGPHLRFNSASNQMRFRFYKSASYAAQQPVQLYRLDYTADVAAGAKAFADKFVAAPICGTDDNTPANAGEFDKFVTEYSKLSRDVRAYLANGDGKGEASFDAFYAKYKAIMDKRASNNEFYDFLAGKYRPAKTQGVFGINQNITDSTTWSLVGIGAVTIAASASLLFFRRKKSN